MAACWVACGNRSWAAPTPAIFSTKGISRRRDSADRLAIAKHRAPESRTLECSDLSLENFDAILGIVEGGYEEGDDVSVGEKQFLCF